jgi:hypothetical protein
MNSIERLGPMQPEANEGDRDEGGRNTSAAGKGIVLLEESKGPHREVLRDVSVVQRRTKVLSLIAAASQWLCSKSQGLSSASPGGSPKPLFRRPPRNRHISSSCKPRP